jgi:hypothetical protein
MQRFSEPFPPHGALAAEGAENLLGRPRLDPLVVLVREAVQNSWDARRGDGGITFDARLHHLDPIEGQILRAQVFADPPDAATRLRSVLRDDDLFLLALTDKGTLGLGGPVRADRPAARGEPSNFVDLLFNIGQPADRDERGGTYGFGRTIAFVVSEARAVVVYSRTTVGRRRTSRAIAVAFTDHYSSGSRRYTGRHWWGRTVDESIEPIVGDEADHLAASIGLAPFAPDETGTTIAVVAPDLRERTPLQAGHFLAHALMWNFWPKMLTDDASPEPAIRFTVAVEGDEIAIPDPERTPPLPSFVASLRAVRNGTAASIDLPRTGERIGRLGLTRAPVHPRPLVDDGSDALEERGSAAGFEGPAHHVALLREPELVVQYLPTAELPSASEEYGGVFKPERVVDRAFAKAEPPTHDAWHPELVSETKLRRFVAVALRSVREHTERMADRADPNATDANVAAVARALDDLFRPADRRTGGISSSPRIAVGSSTLSFQAGDVVASVPFDVEHAPQSRGTSVVATVHLASHDGWTADRSVPAGEPQPQIVGFATTSDAARIEVEGDRLDVGRGARSEWYVFVRSSAKVAVTLDLVPEPIRSDGREEPG